LYCCYQNPAINRRREFTFYGHPAPAGNTINYASYQSSTGNHQERLIGSTSGGGAQQRQYTYERNGNYQ
jgi:hypothetical protein